VDCTTRDIEISKRIVPDDVLCDYSSKIKEHKQKNPDNPLPQSVPGFFRSLEPMDGALAAVE
jgi:5'-nucleotidase